MSLKQRVSLLLVQRPPCDVITAPKGHLQFVRGQLHNGRSAWPWLGAVHGRRDGREPLYHGQPRWGLLQDTNSHETAGARHNGTFGNHSGGHFERAGATDWSDLISTSLPLPHSCNGCPSTCPCPLLCRQHCSCSF